MCLIGTLGTYCLVFRLSPPKAVESAYAIALYHDPSTLQVSRRQFMQLKKKLVGRALSCHRSESQVLRTIPAFKTGISAPPGKRKCRCPQVPPCLWNLDQPHTTPPRPNEVRTLLICVVGFLVVVDACTVSRSSRLLLNYTRLALFLRGRPFSLRILISTSASHLLALYNWTPLIACLITMKGKLIPAIAHGIRESILLARAISSAEALKGSGNICRSSEVLTGAPGLMKPPLVSSTLLIRWGDSQGDEKARR